MFDSQFNTRFRKNKLSLVGGAFILFMCFVAMLGYIITPDSSPFANNQSLSIAAKPPMFKVKLFGVKKNMDIPKVGLFSALAYGRESDVSYIPVQSYVIKGDSVTLSEYVSDTSELSFVSRYHIVDVAFALNTSVAIQKSADSSYQFAEIDGTKCSLKRSEVIQIINRDCVISKTYLLGTDRFGRDLLSRLIIGTRVSLSVGFISVFISLIIGILLGVLAGYYRGWVDGLISWLINVVWSVPTLLMVLSITLVLGKGFWQIFIAVGLTMWVEVARVVRGQVLGVREKEYIEAARALGYSNNRIIFRHILPNIIGPVVIISAANFASAILMEAGLSFLGIGVQPPVPSWGNMIKDHYMYIILDQAYLAILPGLAIMLLVLAFNFLGDGLRDGFDTRME